MDDRKSYQVLVLTKDYKEFLWVKSLIDDTDSLSVQWNVHTDPDTFATLFNDHQFDAILWDCGFTDCDPLTFLSCLTVESEQTPVICLGSEPETHLPKALFQAGAVDYLCKRFLSGWGLEKAIHYAYFRREADNKVDHRNTIDSLTGIVNRNIFFDRLRHSLLRAERNKELIGVAIVNIDGFSKINENLGYRAGDQLIRLVANRLQKAVRKSDSIARVAGDEFAIVLERLDDFYSGTSVAEKILDLFEIPFSLEEDSLTICASLGIACYPESARSAEALFKYANRAMVNAKEDHGNSFRFYDQEMNSVLSSNLKLEAEFRQAIRSDQLRLFYQPRIDIANSEIVGMECLIRWQHPERGLLAPDAFIELAEKTGMIVPMGYWVISQACKDLSRMQAMGYSNLICAVNLSFRQFLDKKLTETVFRIIYNSEVDTTDLEFELTESAMMKDLDHTCRCLEEMGKMGLTFALDDFGTGFSSFTTLQTLPISTLKIDKSFVQAVEQDDSSRMIVSAMIQLAHNMGMSVVAEGVENEKQLSFLQYHLCDQVQGYYFGKPVDYDTFLGMLKKYYPQNRLSKIK